MWNHSSGKHSDAEMSHAKISRFRARAVCRSNKENKKKTEKNGKKRLHWREAHATPRHPTLPDNSEMALAEKIPGRIYPKTNPNTHTGKKKNKHKKKEEETQKKKK